MGRKKTETDTDTQADTDRPSEKETAPAAAPAPGPRAQAPTKRRADPGLVLEPKDAAKLPGDGRVVGGREMCTPCNGNGKMKSGACDPCNGTGWRDGKAA